MEESSRTCYFPLLSTCSVCSKTHFSAVVIMMHHVIRAEKECTDPLRSVWVLIQVLVQWKSNVSCLIHTFIFYTHTSGEIKEENPVSDCSAAPPHHITNLVVFLYSSTKYETCHSFQFWPINPHKLIFVFISLVYSYWDLVYCIHIHFSSSELFLYPLLTLPVFSPHWEELV